MEMRSPYEAFCQLQTAFTVLKRSQRREIAHCEFKSKEEIEACFTMASSDCDAATLACRELQLNPFRGRFTKAKLVIMNRIIKDCEAEMASCRLILSFFD